MDADADDDDDDDDAAAAAAELSQCPKQMPRQEPQQQQQQPQQSRSRQEVYANWLTDFGFDLRTNNAKYPSSRLPFSFLPFPHLLVVLALPAAAAHCICIDVAVGHVSWPETSPKPTPLPPSLPWPVDAVNIMKTFAYCAVYVENKIWLLTLFNLFALLLPSWRKMGEIHAELQPGKVRGVKVKAAASEALLQSELKILLTQAIFAQDLCLLCQKGYR